MIIGRNKNMEKNKNLNKKVAKNKMSKNQKGAIIGGIAVVLAVILIVFGINGGKEEKQMIHENVKVLVEMENGEDFVIELYPEYAPQTVQNFVDLVTDGFYDGVGFHRVVEGFMAQGGDPEGTGMGGSGVNIPGEFAGNGFAQNTLSHTRGVISMARSMDPDSASSQFFICYDDASFLDGQYAAFGKVIEGMETVDNFLNVKRTYNSMGEEASPTEPITMKRVTLIEE
jgi:cyclophilin family peptidyl-prolyl cis-trans isomerase